MRRRCNVIRGVGNLPFYGTGSSAPCADVYKPYEGGMCSRTNPCYATTAVMVPCPEGVMNPSGKSVSSTNQRAFNALPWLALALLVALVVR